MRIAARFNGPPGSANGGVACGRLAAYVGAPAVEVTLRRPPPLDTDLRVDASGGTARLYDGELLVAEAVPTEVDVDPGPPVTVEQAAQAELAYAGLLDHPFPTCFACGPKHEHGLDLRPGPVGDGRVSATWTPLDDDPVLVWAALDCPGGWVGHDPGSARVLGRMALRRTGDLVPGARHVLVARLVRQEGRKSLTASALLGPDGTPVALSSAVWITLPS